MFSPHLLPIVQELVGCSILLLKLTRQLEQRLLEEGQPPETGSLGTLEQDTLEHRDQMSPFREAEQGTKQGVSQGAERGGRQSTASHDEGDSAEPDTQRARPRSLTDVKQLSQCRACQSKVFLVPTESTLHNLDGSDHAQTCPMRHLLRHSAGR